MIHDNYQMMLLKAVPITEPSQGLGVQKKGDPELLYVECKECGRPVIWDSGQTTRLLEQVGIDSNFIDAQCLMLTEGCPQCKPDRVGFAISMLRLSSLSPEDKLLLDAPAKGVA